MINKELEKFFNDNKNVAIGFSGGVDSSYLLYVGKKLGANISPYFVKSDFQPQFELDDAKRLCEELDIDLKIINLDVLDNEIVTDNPQNRCYYCKQEIFGRLKKEALADGYNVLVDGTNASDDVEDRPGMKALSELDVRSPLREAGLTKKEIRKLSKDAGLFTWNKPSYACLATRVPTDEKITKEILEKIEKSEGELFDLGFTNFRIRVFNNAARIQVDKDELDKFIKNRKLILEKLKPYFEIVMLDLEVR